MKIVSIIFLAFYLCVLSHIAQAQVPISNELFDYLAQDVCVDSNNVAYDQDPFSCPSNRRNIAIGEPSPYIMTDFDRQNGATYMATTSFPVLSTDGKTEILVSKNLQGNFNADFIFNFSEPRDGYDLIDTYYSGYTSIVRTSDGNCYDQLFSRYFRTGPISTRAGGWVMFPRLVAPSTWTTTNQVSNQTYKFQLSQGRPGCSNSDSLGVTYWNAPTTYEFESTKQLLAIRTDHFASSSLSQSDNALERFYFTREYGLTRWEAWMPQSRCFTQFGASNPICRPDAPDYPLNGRCSRMNVSASGYAGLDFWGGQNWIRYDCRDQTFYQRLNHPQIMRDSYMARSNGWSDLAP